LFGGAIGFYYFNKTVEGLENKVADYLLSSDELFDAFDQNEPEAQEKYVGKILEIRGEVIRTNLNDSIPTITLKAENSMFGGVNCSFPKAIKHVNNGEVIVVKCNCQGYLMDVILNNCMVVKK
jgi:hypothetical protein